MTEQRPTTSFLDSELAARGAVASVSNSIFALFMLAHPFGTVIYADPIRALASLTLILSALRFVLSKRFLRDSSASSFPLKVVIAAHSVVFAIIGCLAFWELDYTGVDFSILVAIVVGFTTGAIITLSYDRRLFELHVGLILGSIVVLSVLKGALGNDPEGLRYSLLIAIYLAYLHFQFKAFHQQTVQKAVYEKELERSNEEIRNSTEKLIQSSRFEALGDMAQGLAHEINNSTMVILGSAQQVERELRKESILSEKNEKRIKAVVDAVLRMKTIIDGLKSFSQQMDKEDKVPTPLTQIMERTLHYIQEMLRAHAVRFEITPYTEELIPCQPLQVTHILFNLIRNADDAIRELPVEQRWIRLQIVNEPDHIDFRISNGGPVIPPELRRRLFQPFYSTKDINAGTGLSLSSARGLARDHGGEIYLDEKSTHTTFVLRLPK